MVQLLCQYPLLSGQHRELRAAGLDFRGLPFDALAPGVPRLHQAAQLLHPGLQPAGILYAALRLRPGEQSPRSRSISAAALPASRRPAQAAD